MLPELKIRKLFNGIDWTLLAEQKRALLDIENNSAVDGILGLIDALQDAAAAEGYPVVWLGDDSDCEHKWNEDEDGIEVCALCGEERGEDR